MLHTLKYLLPALIPSWRFFDMIAPSPRIEFTLLNNEHDEPAAWREFRPRPDHLTTGQLLARLVWNPRWNESLYLVTCAERLMEHNSAFRIREIAARIMADHPAPFMQFRLILISRNGARLERQIVFTSQTIPCAGAAP